MSTITRRAILRGSTVAAAAAAVSGLPAIASAHSSDDAELVAAERESLVAWQAAAASVDKTGDVDNEIAEQANALDRFIHTTPCATAAGAAVKLRRLLDPEVGMQIGEGDHDWDSLGHVLAFLERQASREVRS
jgi:hypothetical protein